MIKKIIIKSLSFPLFSLITQFLVAFPWPNFVVQFFIHQVFIKGYHVNWKEAEKPVKNYSTIVAFFIRKLKKGARPISPNEKDIISPVDGQVMDKGKITNDDKDSYLVKGKAYSLSSLIGREKVGEYQGGDYLILYLSPKDYHRIHHIKKTNIKKVEYFPGQLLPVNLYSLLNFNDVFGKNRRALIEYEAPFIMVLVGALNVGKIELCDFPEFYKKAKKNKRLVPFRYELDVSKKVNRGDEAGIFYLGSTVILLFKKNTAHLQLKTGETIQMGRPLGRWLS